MPVKPILFCTNTPDAETKERFPQQGKVSALKLSSNLDYAEHS